MSRGSAVLAGAGGAGDRAWAGCCHALTRSRETLQGQGSVAGAFGPFLCSSGNFLLARESGGWGCHGLEGMPESLCRHSPSSRLCFCHSPSVLEGRQQTLHLFPGNSNHLHPERSKGAAESRMHPASALLLVLLSQAETQPSSGKWLCFNKAGATNPKPLVPFTCVTDTQRG